MDNYIELMKTHVLISREEYDKFVMLKTYADAAESDVKDLINKSETLAANVKKHAMKGNNTILDILFKESRMSFDSRQEQTDVHSSYFGFEKAAKTFLNENGYDDSALVAYINLRWDIYENKERKE